MSKNCIFICDGDAVPGVYGEALMRELSDDPRVYKKSDILDPARDFSAVEYVFSTWGMPAFSEAAIRTHLPNLKAVFYGAGTVQGFAREFLGCGVRVFSAWGANAIPVAEYALAQILLATKGFYATSALQSVGSTDAANTLKAAYPGAFGTAVGIIGVGMIGRKLLELLRGFSLDLYAYDAFLGEAEIAALGAKKLSLEELFERCFVVSNHLANNAQTVGMLHYDHFRRLPSHAAFINTGRGAQVVEDDLARILAERPDLTALLDVTWPEPPNKGHPFYELKNCILTPHIAGSSGGEVRRMGEFMRDAYRAVLAGEPSACEVSLEMLATMA